MIPWLPVGLPHPRHLGLPQAGGARHLELRDRPAPVSLLSCRPVENFRLSSQPEIEQRAFLWSHNNPSSYWLSDTFIGYWQLFTWGFLQVSGELYTMNNEAHTPVCLVLTRGNCPDCATTWSLSLSQYAMSPALSLQYSPSESHFCISFYQNISLWVIWCWCIK